MIFAPVISPTDWMCFLISLWAVYLDYFLFPNSVSWGSLGVFSVCGLGPYITLSGQPPMLGADSVAQDSAGVSLRAASLTPAGQTY